MILVSDTSPIINLARINQLQLLPDLFGKVILPKSVFEEIVVKGHGQPGADEIREAKWVKVMEAEQKTSLEILQQQLDPGEAEAIVLALEIQADYLLIDERKGRRIAKSFHLEVLGLLGILMRAKSKGLIPEIKRPMDRLISESGFWVSQKLYEKVLEEAGENQ